MRKIKRDSNAFHLNGKTDAFSPTEIGVAASRSSEGGGNQEFSFWKHLVCHVYLSSKWSYQENRWLGKTRVQDSGLGWRLSKE